MNERRKQACLKTIRNCEKALNRLLEVGEKADLLLDHFSWIRDSMEAGEDFA
jgi:hypothetical protein